MIERKITMERPKPMKPVKLKNVSLQDYEIFNKLERSMHLEDVLLRNSNSLLASEVSTKDDSFIQNRGIQVLWFGVSRQHPSENHFYGNVSFIISLDKILKDFQDNFNIYWLESLDLKSHFVSRVFLTSKPLDDLHPAIAINFKELGFPLYQDRSGNFYHLKNMPGYEHGHVVEFMIDVRSDSDCKWIFDNSQRLAVNHTKANTFSGNDFSTLACHEFNKRRLVCPSSFSRKQVKLKVCCSLPNFFSERKSFHFRIRSEKRTEIKHKRRKKKLWRKFKSIEL
ncbi:unnamed protein product [Meganyctiphanes norvegica]|uniref:Uncharacterized protein n=1 Tax=Meganyctiphanes norvegica TaxID=48144 RepID=A0AAV2REL4_MEGNR